MRWFRPLGPVFAPVSVMGWVVTLAAVAFCVNTFIAIDHRSHSVSDTPLRPLPLLGPHLPRLGLDRRANGAGAPFPAHPGEGRDPGQVTVGVKQASTAAPG